MKIDLTRNDPSIKLIFIHFNTQNNTHTISVLILLNIFVKTFFLPRCCNLVQKDVYNKVSMRQLFTLTKRKNVNFEEKNDRGQFHT